MVSEKRVSIDGLWAAMTYEADGQEQIVSFHGYVLVAPDPERLPMIREIAASIAMSKGVEISLVRFKGRKVVERWGADGKIRGRSLVPKVIASASPLPPKAGGYQHWEGPREDAKYKPNHLREWREWVGISQSMLAARAGMFQEHISATENCRMRIRVPHLMALGEIIDNENPLDLLHRSPLEVFGGKTWEEVCKARAPKRVEKSLAIPGAHLLPKVRAKGKKP